VNGYLYSIEFDGTAAKSGFKMTVRRDRRLGSGRTTTIDSVFGDTVGKFYSRRADVDGTGVAMDPDAYIGKLRLQSVTNGADISMPGVPDFQERGTRGLRRGLSIKANSFSAGTDTTIAWGVNRFYVDDVHGGSATTPWIRRLATRRSVRRNTNGHFRADLLLSGIGAPGGLTLGTARIARDLGSGNQANPMLWDITGDVYSIKAKRGITDGWSLDLHSDIHSLRLGDVRNADVSIGDVDANGFRGDAWFISAKQWLVGDIDLGSVQYFNITGDRRNGMDGDTCAMLTLTGSSDPAATNTLGRARVAGRILDCVWNILTGDVDSVSAGVIDGSAIRTGVEQAVPWTELPDNAADFTAAGSRIGAVTLRGLRGQPDTAPTFMDSILAAWEVGRLRLGLVDTDNAGVECGVASHSVGSLDGRTDAQQLPTQPPFTPNEFGDFKLVVV